MENDDNEVKNFIKSYPYYDIEHVLRIKLSKATVRESHLRVMAPRGPDLFLKASESDRLRLRDYYIIGQSQADERRELFSFDDGTFSLYETTYETYVMRSFPSGDSNEAFPKEFRRMGYIEKVDENSILSFFIKSHSSSDDYSHSWRHEREMESRIENKGGRVTFKNASIYSRST